MKIYKKPIFTEYVFFVITSLMIIYIAIGGINILTVVICALLSLALLFKAKEYNYLFLSDDGIIIKNLFSRKEQRYSFNDIEHIEFSRPMGIGSAIYIKILTHSCWSKRYYIRLVSDTQLKEFIIEIKKLNVAIEYNDIKKFI